jgi:hypothetical protein
LQGFTVLHDAFFDSLRFRAIMTSVNLPRGFVISLPATLRRVSSVTLAVAFVAMATSGLLMLVVDRLGFQLRMHPVHNAFGVIMVVAGLLHAGFNWKALTAHVRPRWAMTLGALLAGVMVLLLLGGLTRPIDGEVIRKVDDILSAANRAAHQ